MPFDRRLGLAGLLVGLLAIFLFYLLPDARWIGWLVFFAAIGLGVFWAVAEVRAKVERGGQMALVLVVIVGALVGGVSAGIAWRLAQRDTVTTADTSDSPRQRRYLEADAPNYVAHAEVFTAGPAPMAPPGRVVVDVTDRPEAQVGDIYDTGAGVFRRPKPSDGAKDSHASQSVELSRDRGSSAKPPTADEIADALARKLRPVGGLYPPFSLGGSLQRGDLFDITMDGGPGGRETWRPVKNARDIEVDWSQFRDTTLMIDAAVRGGNFRFGLWDVANEVPVVTSPWISHAPSDLSWDDLASAKTAPEQLRHFRIAIPRSIGRKTYRLAVQPTQDRSAATFWIAGDITFQSIDLGGNLSKWFSPNEGDTLRARVPDSLPARLDWRLVHDPVSAVIAEVTLVSSYPVFQSSERARALIRDLGDNSVVSTEWVSVSWTGGIMGSTRPYPGPVVKKMRFQLPAKTETHTYVLEVEVSKSGMSVTATGVLYLRH